MREHARKLHSAALQYLADFQQRVLIWLDSRAVAVGIDLYEHHKRMAVVLAEAGNGLGAFDAVGEDLESAAAPAQIQGLGQSVRGHADGIENVGHALGKELLGFLERRYRDAAGPGCALCRHHLGAFGGLDMRAKAHAQRVGALLHAGNVALHLLERDDGRGSIEGGEGVVHGFQSR